MHNQDDFKLLIRSLLEMVSSPSNSKSPTKLVHFKRKTRVFAEGMKSDCCMIFAHLNKS